VKRQISEEERDFVISVLFSDVLNRMTFVKISNEFIEAIIERVLAHHVSADDALSALFVYRQRITNIPGSR